MVLLQPLFPLVSAKLFIGFHFAAFVSEALRHAHRGGWFFLDGKELQVHIPSIPFWT